ncbi:hypothetical protein DB88DRAFT_532229 [Papiliotrema laurentii]|uniref:Uncharacterized protein n=1 Tax=Papiliotrema laurentii TaxID=5418 RepID=A0AAD9FPI7_PAPLA|nr:hypothetical protein DB88DRAFT_532229 [Papiliotrema laurentii]
MVPYYELLPFDLGHLLKLVDFPFLCVAAPLIFLSPLMQRSKQSGQERVPFPLSRSRPINAGPSARPFATTHPFNPSSFINTPTLLVSILLSVRSTPMDTPSSFEDSSFEESWERGRGGGGGTDHWIPQSWTRDVSLEEVRRRLPADAYFEPSSTNRFTLTTTRQGTVTLTIYQGDKEVDAMTLESFDRFGKRYIPKGKDISFGEKVREPPSDPAVTPADCQMVQRKPESEGVETEVTPEDWELVPPNPESQKGDTEVYRNQ